jgi:hypothetical protein
VRAVSLGHAVDGAVGGSETAQKLLAGYLEGEQSLTADIKDILARPALSTESLKNLGVTAALTQLMHAMADGHKVKVKSLIDRAKELGLE